MELVEFPRLSYESRQDKIRLCFLGDLHRSAAGCDSDQWLRDIESIRRDPNAYAILQGDLFNGVSLSHKHFEFTDIHRDFKTLDLSRLISMERDAVIDELRPIAHKVLLALKGNHDDRSRQIAGIDVHYDLCQALQVRNGDYACLWRWLLTRSKKSWNVQKVAGGWLLTGFAHHGWFGGARTRGAEANHLQRAMAECEADLISCGHSHGEGVQKAVTIRITQSGEPKIKRRERLAFSTGTYLHRSTKGTDNYAERKNYPLSPLIGMRVVEIIPNTQQVSIAHTAQMGAEDGGDFTLPPDEEASRPIERIDT